MAIDPPFRSITRRDKIAVRTKTVVIVWKLMPPSPPATTKTKVTRDQPAIRSISGILRWGRINIPIIKSIAQTINSATSPVI